MTREPTGFALPQSLFPGQDWNSFRRALEVKDSIILRQRGSYEIRSALAKRHDPLVTDPELAAGVDGLELDVLDSPPDAAFVSGFASDFVSAFFSLAVPSPLDELLFDA